MNGYRLFIYPKDVAIITGKGLRHAQKQLRDIHTALGKKEHQRVSIEDFAHYEGLDVEAVRAACMGRTTRDR